MMSASVPHSVQGNLGIVGAWWPFVLAPQISKRQWWRRGGMIWGLKEKWRGQVVGQEERNREKRKR